MLISFYHISLCPRCGNTRKHLQELLGSSYSQTVTELNILKHPRRAGQDGIKMVPAITCGEASISGLILSHRSIRNFLEENGVIDGSANERS